MTKETWGEYERRYRRLGPKFKDFIEQLREYGLAPSEAWEDNSEDYGWSAIFERPDGNKLDVTIALIDSNSASGDHEPGVAGAIRLDIVENGGLIVGGFCPHNYTDKVWVRYRDAAEFNDRMALFTDAVPDVADTIQNWLTRTAGLE